MSNAAEHKSKCSEHIGITNFPDGMDLIGLTMMKILGDFFPYSSFVEVFATNLSHFVMFEVIPFHYYLQTNQVYCLSQSRKQIQMHRFYLIYNR